MRTHVMRQAGASVEEKQRVVCKWKSRLQHCSNMGGPLVRYVQSIQMGVEGGQHLTVDYMRARACLKRASWSNFHHDSESEG